MDHSAKHKEHLQKNLLKIPIITVSIYPALITMCYLFLSLFISLVALSFILRVQRAFILFNIAIITFIVILGYAHAAYKEVKNELTK